MVVFPVIMSCVVDNFSSQFAAVRYHGISVTGASTEEQIFHEWVKPQNEKGWFWIIG